MSHFNQSAENWDTPEKIQMMGKLASQTIAALQLPATADTDLDIVDFGCGTGLFGLEFADHARSLTGIDTSEGMLNVFRKKTASAPHCRAVAVDLTQRQFPENALQDVQADLILSSMAFHHLKQPADVLNKLMRLLAANGTIAIVDLDEEDGTFHPDNKAMGVQHFGFSKKAVAEWARYNDLSLQHKIIHTIEKNDRSYAFFLAIMKRLP